jgi:microcystin-dependent protein
LVVPSPVAEGDEITDGDVTWKVKKIGGAGDAGDGVPLGAIIAYSANGDLPSGYLLCDGAAVSRTMYPDLFAAIGTTYGSGDGSTTFNLPDYNTAQRFAQGGTVAGTVKSAGLPNVEGTLKSLSGVSSNIAPLGANAVTQGAVIATSLDKSGHLPGSSDDGYAQYGLSIDASQSNPIYGASTTVQPPALTCRYIIKAFDGQTPDSALIDITQYAQELAHKADITGSNMAYHKDVITTSGTYTAPVTGLYKITVKGGGGGGQGGRISGNNWTGSGGGEGGTTVGWEHLSVGDPVSVIVGAGGTGGTAGNNNATSGGNSSVTVNDTTYTGGGGSVGTYSGGAGGQGGAGTIIGAPGESSRGVSSSGQGGSSGGGNGGAAGVASGTPLTATDGGGGAGGACSASSTYNGGAGGDGYVWFEFYTPGA